MKPILDKSADCGDAALRCHVSPRQGPCPGATMTLSQTAGLLGPPIMDIEASGFGAGSYPIEIGFVLCNGDAYCTLIAPEPDWTHWDLSAQAVHGIDRSMLIRHGKPANQVAAELDRLLANSIVYSDAWCHDYSWLARLYAAAGHAPAFKLASLHSVVGEVDRARWDAVKAGVLQRDGGQRHRASADARVLQRTVAELLMEPAA